MSLKNLFTDEEYRILNIDTMDEQQSQILENWAVRMIRQMQPEQGDITRIKYDGKLIQLANGKRYEIDEFDAFTSDMWSEGDPVIILDGKMYNLESAESVGCEEDR